MLGVLPLPKVLVRHPFSFTSAPLKVAKNLAGSVLGSARSVMTRERSFSFANAL